MFNFDSKGDEKRALTILFWALSPVLFIVFFRLFWVIFGVVYGGLLYLVLGSGFTGLISISSFVTSLVFTILTLRYLYLQFRMHIIGNV